MTVAKLALAALAALTPAAPPAPQICPHTCGVCSHICADLDESCPQWAKEGECKSNADHMLKNCPTSCGICTPKCVDIHTDCNHWLKEGECTTNPGFMYAAPQRPQRRLSLARAAAAGPARRTPAHAAPPRARAAGT